MSNQEKSLLDQIYELFDQNETSNEIKVLIDKLLSNVYGLLLTFLSDELTPQQRQIWLVLTRIFPETQTGLELARATGSSESSKTIYKSIKRLEELNLIVVEEPRPKVKNICANENHPLSKLLIDLGRYYGMNI